ncbi:hypothetical protein BBAD15_g10116 [Beauveria bassiana D1-5]|uniref:NAD-dependent epimerase/dehydratase domain-containing protein n=1 Tax=Beauveria bassiana D1-5 TaxID=1245745 RepID=A0A0A2VEV0_BEABA|nr:hypothetical protein BBAD15_g10116 [Beauveria bassiana D1-5]
MFVSIQEWRRRSDNERCICVGADLTVGEEFTRLLAVNSSWNAIFIFHGIISVGCETNPALSTKVNIEATQALLTAVSRLRSGDKKPRVVYASTQAVYGPPYTTNENITDDTPATPVGVYGTHKLMMELFINDLHRRGLLDAFSVRLPTVTARPGAPSRSAASSLSGMLRETVAGQAYVMPIDDYSAPSDAMPAHIRAVYMPGIFVTVGEMVRAVGALCGEENLALLKVERDVEAERLLKSWPQISDFGDAKRLSLVFDSDCEQIFHEYVDSLN